MKSGASILAARSFFQTRLREHLISNRKTLEGYHSRRIRALTDYLSRNIAYFQQSCGKRFDQWPITDKALLMSNFSDMNIGGIEASTVRDAIAAGSERVEGFIVGQSTGTSGNRGYYLISDAERFVWLGTILAKTLPDALWQRHRVALALPGLSMLYRSASTGSRITLGFFDLAKPIEEWSRQLAPFAPDTIVAPPKVLRWLAERNLLHAVHIFSGAEVLDPIDREIIEAATGRVVREIYMATEGLFGVSCAHGTLHLAEDVVHFELEPVAAGSVLQSPIVTDFTRRAQALIRYRMNDLLELADTPCACGSPYRAVRHIEGRSDDIFRLADRDGTLQLVTPDVLRNAVVDSHPTIRDFRVDQTGPSDIQITLAYDVAAEIDALVLANLYRSLSVLGLKPAITLSRGIEPIGDRKLRRVRRLWSEA
jgi:putative adenylate-forming enzyme